MKPLMLTLLLMSLSLVSGCQSSAISKQASELEVDSSKQNSISFEIIDTEFPYGKNFPIDQLSKFSLLGSHSRSRVMSDGSRINIRYELIITNEMARKMPKFDFFNSVIPLNLEEASEIAYAAFKLKKGHSYSKASAYFRPFVQVNKSSYYFDFQFPELRLIVLPNGNVVYEKEVFRKTFPPKLSKSETSVEK
ncbi:hypothetical protein [Shewanella atlantica]|uniref:hypothetical protein n=1 Tax=Shewanella atlantica TaxID=271099 RepID=UPI003734D7B7